MSTQNSDITVGDAGRGALVVEIGATLNYDRQHNLDTGGTGGNIVLGNQLTGYGALSIVGGFPQTTVIGNVTIGKQGQGQVHISKGGALIAGTVVLAAGGSTASGAMSIDGTNNALGAAGASAATVQNLSIGQQGTGNVSVTGGGSLKATSSLDIGVGAQANGSLTLGGNGSQLSVGKIAVTVGDAGTGTFTIENGAQLDLRQNQVVLGARPTPTARSRSTIPSARPRSRSARSRSAAPERERSRSWAASRIRPAA